ncbi:MAG: hypothetical protein AB7L71_03265 [Vicinamibacterales bacterium]
MHTPAPASLVRVAFFVTLVFWWANLALTSRWREVPGALHGARLPWFVTALGILTLLAVRPRRPQASLTARDGRLLAGAGSLLLGATFLVWFPPYTWSQIPWLDDWIPRFRSTREFIDLLATGRAAGWQWDFLGGYHTSSDVTQSLGLLAAVPMTILGDAAGFHALHLLLFAAIPALLWLDLSLDPGDADGHPHAMAGVAAGIGAVLAAGYSYTLIRSGDTNSLAGAVLVLSTLVGAHAARRGRWWGGHWLLVSLVFVAWSHAGSFVYALVYLGLDALLARDWRSAARAGTAALVAQCAALPMTWESWRYPDLFLFNNVLYSPPTAIDWTALARKVAYNVELLWLPGRWSNDYGALALILLPATAALLVVDRTRTRLYAAAALATVVMMRLNDPHFGYAFIRPIHMFPLLLAPVIARVSTRHLSRTGGVALLATVAIFIQIWWQPVPHIRSMRDVFPELVDRVARGDGALVLVENNPHRNTNAEPGGETVVSLTGNHYEALLAHETGRRLYAGYWDGWQWTPWRGRMLSGGTWMGQDIRDVSHDRMVGELQSWGVVDVFVWSARSRAYFEQDSRFTRVWAEGPWTQFRRSDADGREVVTMAGAGALEDRSLHGGAIVLRGVPLGSPVVVRTSYHPSWRASVDQRSVPLYEKDGQLAFIAPCAQDCTVLLDYPRRSWLWGVAVGALLLGVALLRYDFGMVQK